MKTLYLHIGTSKTGTTSIQHFCTENAEIFEKKGYSYPIFPHKFKDTNIMRNAHFLAHRAYNEDDSRNLLEEEQYFRQGMDFVLDSFKKADNVILSDEGIWSVILKGEKPELLNKIMKEASEHNYAVKVIVYLRRQDGMADSWWNQKIKVGGRLFSTISWEEYVKNPVNPEMNYYRPLKLVEEAVGKENMIVRRFGRKYFKNGSLFEDFVDALGMEYSSRFIVSEGQRNISLLGNAHEIKRVLNTLPELSNADNTFFRRITAGMSEQRPDLKSETMFSSEEALEFMEQYRESNRKIMQEYFGKDEDLFDMDFSGNKKWVLDHTEMEKDIILFMGRAIVELREENKELKTRMGEMEKEMVRNKKVLKELQEKKTNPLKSFLSSAKKDGQD